MNDLIKIEFYPPFEEKINIISHALGLFLSLMGCIALIIHASLDGTVWHIVSFSIYGASLIVLYTASTCYHACKEPVLRRKLNILDHTAIYILIAGSYTPFTLVTLNGTIGWIIFGLTWGLALIGIILKLFFTGKYELISVLAYVFMGWLIIFAIKPLMNNLPTMGLYWLVAGGIFYTLGAILYAIEKLKFNHALFHLFVLMGSICQFITVYCYVLTFN